MFSKIDDFKNFSPLFGYITDERAEKIIETMKGPGAEGEKSSFVKKIKAGQWQELLEKTGEEGTITKTAYLGLNALLQKEISLTELASLFVFLNVIPYAASYKVVSLEERDSLCEKYLKKVLLFNFKDPLPEEKNEYKVAEKTLDNFFRFPSVKMYARDIERKGYQFGIDSFALQEEWIASKTVGYRHQLQPILDATSTREEMLSRMKKGYSDYLLPFPGEKSQERIHGIQDWGFWFSLHDYTHSVSRAIHFSKKETMEKIVAIGEVVLAFLEDRPGYSVPIKEQNIFPLIDPTATEEDLTRYVMDIFLGALIDGNTEFHGLEKIDLFNLLFNREDRENLISVLEGIMLFTVNGIIEVQKGNKALLPEVEIHSGLKTSKNRNFLATRTVFEFIDFIEKQKRKSIPIEDNKKRLREENPEDPLSKKIKKD